MKAPKFCTQCGSPITPGSVFCSNCGTKIVYLDEEEELTPIPVEEEPAPIPVPVEEEPLEEVIEEESIEEVEEEASPEQIVEEEEKIEEQLSEPVVEEEKIEEQPSEPIVEEQVEEQPSEPIVEEEPIKEEPVIDQKVEETIEEFKQVISEKSSPIGKAIAVEAGAYIFGHLEEEEQKNQRDDEGDDLLEPRKLYVNSLQREHEQNTIQYFDDLVKKSGVDAGENEKTILEHRKASNAKTLLEKQLTKKKVQFSLMFPAMLCMIFGLSGFIIMGVFAYTGINEDMGLKGQKLATIFIVCGILITLSIILFIIRGVRGSHAKKTFQPKIDALTKKMKELEDRGYQQLAPLNNLFDFNIYNDLLMKTTPIIKVDNHPDMAKVEALMNKFNWGHDMGRNNSTLYMKTGSIKGNPFLIYIANRERVVSETYTGTLTITWTKKVTIGKNTTYVPMTQVLTASVSKPRPDFSKHCQFVFGSEAAPNLSFSRRPMIRDYSEKGLKKLFNEREKEVDSYAKKHPAFTPLGNDEFEDYFDGTNRNNEVEYRMLFTPLAQRSMLDLIKNKEPFGDNFHFSKNKMLNTISLTGASVVDYEGDPRMFQGFSLSDMRANFINLNKRYFYNLYAQLAPILAIPLYQQYPTNEYIFKRDKEKPFSTDLCEMLANRFYQAVFAPNECSTPITIKCENPVVNGNSVKVDVRAYGYKRIAHTEYFSKLGGDGHFHNVPVTWYEYIGINKVTPFIVHETYLNKFQYDTLNRIDEYKKLYAENVRAGDFSFFKGYFTFVKNGTTGYTPSPLNEIIKEKLQ